MARYTPTGQSGDLYHDPKKDLEILTLDSSKQAGPMSTRPPTDLPTHC